MEVYYMYWTKYDWFKFYLKNMRYHEIVIRYSADNGLHIQIVTAFNTINLI